METSEKRKHRWFLGAELAVLVCVASIWAITSGTIDIGTVKAKTPRQVVEVAPGKIGAHEFPAQYCMDSSRNEGATANRTCLELQEQQQLNYLDMELEDFNEYVAQQRQNVENWYAQNLANLQKWAKNILEQLDAEEKAAWARCLQNMNNIASIRSGTGIVSGSGSANTYLITDDYAATNGYFNSNGYFSETTHSFVIGDPAGKYNWERQSIQNSRESIEMEFVKLQQEKQRYLAEIESLADRRRDTIHATKRAVKRNARLKLQGGPGTIDAISTAGRPLVMVEGQTFYEGNVVRGFTIKKIYDYKVEFEKNGQVLVQQLGGRILVKEPD